MKKIKRRFTGPLGSFIKRHLKLHRSLGSLMNGAKHTLHHFDQHLARNYPQAQTVKREMVVSFIESFRHYHSSSLHSMMSNLRQFCRFLFQLNAKTYIPERALIPPAKRKLLPYIYTDKDISKLLQHAKGGLGPAASLRPHTYVTLIALLWVSGLRIGEALRLNLEDVDFSQGILYIRKTKFFKSRIIPLTTSALQALKGYQNKRARYGYDQNPQAAFFINQRAKRCSYESASVTFRGLLKQIRLKTPEGTNPRLHDLRHTFATRWLAEFYQSGKDPNAYLPILATYLGHVNIDCTQTYLHHPITLMKTAGLKFRKHFLNKIER